MSKFQDTIKSRREALNLSVRKASEKIGISHTYLAALEKGVDTRGLPSVKPTPDTLRLISDAYSLSYELLMELCDYESKEERIENRVSNPDIRMIARAGKKMTPEQAENLRKYAQFMFPEAFNDD